MKVAFGAAGLDGSKPAGGIPRLEHAMIRPLAGVAILSVLVLTGGCSSRTRTPGDALDRIISARAPYVGRYLAEPMRTKAGPDVLEVRADGTLEQRSPGGHAFDAAWEPLGERRIAAKPNGASWQRVYTLQPPSTKPGGGTFAFVDHTD